ncbi:MAG: hypothetical protein AVDCRST_MAG66-2049, partial [uncultured Pseudonocardia sp.]
WPLPSKVPGPRSGSRARASGAPRAAAARRCP